MVSLSTNAALVSILVFATVLVVLKLNTPSFSSCHSSRQAHQAHLATERGKSKRCKEKLLAGDVSWDYSGILVKEDDLGARALVQPTFHGQQLCKLPSHAEILKQLENKHFVLFGDSVTRYMYISLVLFLKTGQWPPDVLPKEAGAKHPCWEGTFNDWSNFYDYTTKLFQGEHTFENCDCYRSSNPEEYPWNVTENRFYFDSKHNFRITYLQFFHPSILVHGHASNNPLSKGFGGKLGINFGAAGDYSYEMDGAEFLLKELPTWDPRPDVVVVNSGLWEDIGIVHGGWANFTSRLLHTAHSWNTAEGGKRTRFIWRTTTARRHSYCTDRMMREQSSELGWEIFDAGKITLMLKAAALDRNIHWLEYLRAQGENVTNSASSDGHINFPYLDLVHFQPFVYRHMNQMLLYVLL